MNSADPSICNKLITAGAKAESLLPLPPNFAPRLEVSETATHAVAGELFLAGQWQKVGRSDIDWTLARYNAPKQALKNATLTVVQSLGAAFAATGDATFADAARDYLTDFMAAHPATPYVMKPYDNTLHLAVRIGSQRQPGLLWALPYLAASDAFDDAFVSDIAAWVAGQLEFLKVNIPESINWRIAVADCLMLTSCRLPFRDEAGGWRDAAVPILNDAYHRQFLPDGVHYERTPNYHTWMTYVMTGYWRLATKRPELGLVMATDQIARMWDYALATTRPNGSFNGLHDCHGKTTGPVGFGHETFDIASDRIAFRHDAGLPNDTDASRDGATGFFPHAGQAMLRSDWTQDATYVTFDASGWGGGHCHPARNSVSLHAFGRTLITDPGVVNYDQSDPRCEYLRTTGAHSTLQLGDLNQAEVDPTQTTHHAGAGYDYVRSDYEGGYWEGDYGFGFTNITAGVAGNHCRIMLWIHDLGMVVIDNMWRPPAGPKGSPAEAKAAALPLACRWQCSGDAKIAVSAIGDAVTATYPEAGLLMLLPHRPAGSVVTVHEGESDPPRGWVAEDGQYVPAPQVCITQPVMTETSETFVSVLLPHRDTPPDCTATVEWDAVGRMATLRIARGSGVVDEVHWSYRCDLMLGKRGLLETDAGMTHLRLAASGEPVAAAAIGGTYLRPLTQVVEPKRTIVAWRAGDR